jgi:hypothetical protein
VSAENCSNQWQSGMDSIASEVVHSYPLLQVNEFFGSIFSTLLPGTQARLVPPEGGTFLDGKSWA